MNDPRSDLRNDQKDNPQEDLIKHLVNEDPELHRDKVLRQIGRTSLTKAIFADYVRSRQNRKDGI